MRKRRGRTGHVNGGYYLVVHIFCSPVLSIISKCIQIYLIKRKVKNTFAHTSEQEERIRTKLKELLGIIGMKRACKSLNTRIFSLS